MGSPWDGTPKALYMAFNGLDTLFRRKFNVFSIPERTRKLIRTFPSIYQLIPYQNPFLRDLANKHVSPFTDGVWLDSAQRTMLQDGLVFSQALGMHMSVETLCFFGTRRQTQTSGRVIFQAANVWKEIQWDQPTDFGDGTVPESSAAHPGAKEKLPYPVSHGDIYVDDAVLEKLRYEMIDKYRMAERAVLVTNHLQIVFEQESNPDSDQGHQDFYSPGQTIKLWATVHRLPVDQPIPDRESAEPTENEANHLGDSLNEGKNDLEPVSNASIRVSLLWRQPLPGSPPAEKKNVQAKDLPETYLDKSREVQGMYDGWIVAPQLEGYYELGATVSVIGEPTISLGELIAIEVVPDDVEELEEEG